MRRKISILALLMLFSVTIFNVSSDDFRYLDENGNPINPDNHDYGQPVGVCQYDGEFLRNSLYCYAFYECEGTTPVYHECKGGTIIRYSWGFKIIPMCWNHGEGLCDFVCDCSY